MENKEIYISNGKRPLWHTIIASLCFTACVFIIYLAFFDTGFIRIDRDYGGVAYLFFFILMFGIRFSQVIDYEFNFEKMMYKKFYVFGFFKYSKEFTFQKLKYVAVFNKAAYLYEINLWHGKNKRFVISIYDDPKIALKNAGYIADQLQLDIWDATDAHNGKWVDRDDLIVRD